MTTLRSWMIILFWLFYFHDVNAYDLKELIKVFNESSKNNVMSTTTTFTQSLSVPMSTGVNKIQSTTTTIPIQEMETEYRFNVLWPIGQPIKFSFNETDEEWQQLIRQGLHQWEKETCIEFNENLNATDRLEFIRNNDCYSYLGNTDGAQQISIGNSCKDIGSVLHEIGHALGLHHEHQRLDRDDYIRVDTKSSYCEIQNFNKLIIVNDNFESPYDFGSIMHYDTFACTALPFYKTITTNDPRYQHTVGQHRSLSFLDVKHINDFYCKDTCANTKIKCFNGGYPNPRACNQCKCPSGLGGPNCLSVEETEGCGGELKATNQGQTLMFNGRRRCVWRISAHSNSRVRLILDDAKYRCDDACTSFVEIKHSNDFQTTGFRSCCSENNVKTISNGNQVLIIHDSQELDRNGVFSLRYIQVHNSTAETYN